MPEYIYQNPMFDDPARFAALSPIYQPQAPTYTPGAFDPNARVSEALLASGLSQGGGGLLGGGGAGTALGLLGGAAAVNSLTGGKLVDAAKSALGLGAGGALPAGASYLTPAAEQAAIASGWAPGAGGGTNALAGGAGGDSLFGRAGSAFSDAFSPTSFAGMNPAAVLGLPAAVALMRAPHLFGLADKDKSAMRAQAQREGEGLLDSLTAEFNRTGEVPYVDADGLAEMAAMMADEFKAGRMNYGDGQGNIKTVPDEVYKAVQDAARRFKDYRPSDMR